MQSSHAPLVVVIPLAGKGERFSTAGYREPKPLVRALGRPMILRVVESIGLQAGDLLVVVTLASIAAEGLEGRLRDALPGIRLELVVLERSTRGAAETVQKGLEAIPAGRRDQPVAVIDGDGIVSPSLLASFREDPRHTVFFHRQEQGPPVFSYLETDAQHDIRRMVEKVRISDQACIGVYAFSSAERLQWAIGRVLDAARPDCGEYYLSGVVQALLAAEPVRAREAGEWACLGTPEQLQGWCRRQLIRRRLGRGGADAVEVQEWPDLAMDADHRESLQRETGIYLPEPVPARRWHEVRFGRDEVSKTGPAASIAHEAHWYRSIPAPLRDHAPRLLDRSENGPLGCLRLSRVDGLPFSQVYLEGLLDSADLQRLLDVLRKFHAYPVQAVAPREEQQSIYSNYGCKLDQRLQGMLADRKIRDCFEAIRARASAYRELGRGRQRIVHGDPVFTNVLIGTNNRITLLDPRGNLEGRSTILGDANYDLAKVYQSLTGYDAILLGREPPPNAAQLRSEFESLLSDHLSDLRWITASLYLSLIPLHDTRLKARFLRRAVDCLDAS